MKLTIIFLLSICTFPTLYSQGLSIVWEKKIESDTMGIQWMGTPNFEIDNQNNLLLLIENSKMLPAFIWLNSMGDIVKFDNRFFMKPGDPSYRELNYINKYASSITFSENQKNTLVIHYANPNNSYFVQELFAFEVPREGIMSSYFKEGAEIDLLTGVINTIYTNKSSVIVFFLKGYVRELNLSGQTLWNYEFNVDEILDKQGVLQSFIDPNNGNVVMLSGKYDFRYNTTIDTIYSFQIRNFGVEDTKDSLYLKDVFTFTQYDFGLSNHYLIPKNIFVKNDNYIVVGNLQMVNDTTPYFDNGKQFIATINKQGGVVSFKQLESPFFVNEACISKDSTKIAMLGFEYDKSNLKNRKLGVVEYDLETENVRKVIYADSKGVLFTNSIRSFSNGDYAVTTSAIGDSVIKNGLTPFFYVHRITSSTTSVEDTKPNYKTTVRLEPNPSSQYATVRFLASEELKHVNLVDSRGTFIRNIYTKDISGSFESSVTFRVSDLANGMYYVVVGNGTKTIETVPLSIQR